MTLCEDPAEEMERELESRELKGTGRDQKGGECDRGRKVSPASRSCVLCSDRRDCL